MLIFSTFKHKRNRKFDFFSGVRLIIPPVYEVYRGYIVIAFSVCVFVC